MSVPGTVLSVYRWQREAREPSAPAAQIVFVHGISDCGRCWEPIVTALLDTHPGAVDAIAYDARGHGLSQPLGCAGLPRPTANYADLLSGAVAPESTRAGTGDLPPATLSRLADDLVAVVRALRLRRPLIVGHSMGAITAVLAESRAPGLARGLVLEDPPSPWVEWAGPPATTRTAALDAPPLPEWLATARALSLADSIDQCATASPAWTAEERQTWAASKHAVAADVGWLFAAINRDWSPALLAVRCPTRVVAGEEEHGSLLPAVDAARLAGTLRRGTLTTIAGAGHSVHRDARAAFLSVLREALADA